LVDKNDRFTPRGEIDRDVGALAAHNNPEGHRIQGDGRLQTTSTPIHRRLCKFNQQPVTAPLLHHVSAFVSAFVQVGGGADRGGDGSDDGLALRLEHHAHQHHVHQRREQPERQHLIQSSGFRAHSDSSSTESCTERYNKNNCLAEMWSDSEEDSYFRLID